MLTANYRGAPKTWGIGPEPMVKDIVSPSALPSMENVVKYYNAFNALILSSDMHCLDGLAKVFFRKVAERTRQVSYRPTQEEYLWFLFHLAPVFTVRYVFETTNSKMVKIRASNRVRAIWKHRWVPRTPGHGVFFHCCNENCRLFIETGVVINSQPNHGKITLSQNGVLKYKTPISCDVHADVFVSELCKVGVTMYSEGSNLFFSSPKIVHDD
jgi:hypothetical protein